VCERAEGVHERSPFKVTFVLIRRALERDIEPALAVMSLAYRLDLRAPTVHTLVESLPDGHLLVAQSEDQILGTAAAIGFGATGWIGGIAVADAARGLGLGRELTLAALDALGSRDTVLLLASKLGRPIYDRLGFVAECAYRVFMTTKAPVRADDGFFTPDLDAALALDAAVTGEDRSAVLSSLPACGCGESIAFLPPFPALPIIGPDGAALLSLTRPGMRLAVPETNEAAVDAILALGAVERDPVTRMYRGARVAWRPDQVWGVFSLFFG
jgi:GNAT superfamily N-acetyltransferase